MLKTFHDKFEEDYINWINPLNAVERRTSSGGTAWVEVLKQIEKLNKIIENNTCKTDTHKL